jgi:hypothetical protein
MAGAGYKLFNTGDVLTAAQVNTYLNEQTVMVFASSAARTTALSGVLAEGMMSYLQDTNAVEVYNGTSWVNVGNAGDITEVQAGVGISIASGTGPIPVITNSSTDLITTAGDLLYGTAADTVARLGIGTAGQVLKVNSGATAPEWGTVAAGGGKVLQVVNANITTETAITSASMTDTGITATITPTLATSKIAIFISANTAIQESGQTDIFASAELLRGATQIQDWEQGNGFWQRIGGASGTLRLQGNHAVVYLDSPATTSATTYKLRARVNSPLTTIYFQRDSVPSNILLMEIGV